MFNTILNRTVLALPIRFRRAERVVMPSREAKLPKIAALKAPKIGFLDSWAHLLEVQSNLMIRSHIDD